ncbi:MAG: sigma-70 family RNA polymerase sigma factor [Armatimonadetes bacterium]|nr:sigma-70 family RNA polymerase sigma factor [Armatimonadota bacterium]MDE2206069.1 sigma-70 family RNA polymerase sigma factor [Armatimonadota bacterium]
MQPQVLRIAPSSGTQAYGSNSPAYPVSRLAPTLPLLTAAEEMALAARIEQGDDRARERLIASNYRLVASIALRYQNRGLPMEDLMQEGLIGLMRAAEKYNRARGYRFSTYATHWVRQAISRAVVNAGRSVRLPSYVIDQLARIGKVREALERSLGREAATNELASACGMPADSLQSLLQAVREPVSLDAPPPARDSQRLADQIADNDGPSPLQVAMKTEELVALKNALSRLSEREQQVLRLRYGLGGEEPHTLETIGKKLEMTRESARQIELKALAALRHHPDHRALREAVLGR